jgi:hypothetical protein
MRKLTIVRLVTANNVDVVDIVDNSLLLDAGYRNSH